MGIKRVSPLGMRVLVEIRKDTNQTEAGLFLPEGAKEAMNESVIAEVTEVASAYDHDIRGEANISGVPLHALVLIPKNAGVRIPWNDSLRLVDTKDILAIIHEMSVS
ncbi:co-chaperone GroES [bacterium]|nr:co-chaperone GroES [bacterium]